MCLNCHIYIYAPLPLFDFPPFITLTNEDDGDNNNKKVFMIHYRKRMTELTSKADIMRRKPSRPMMMVMRRTNRVDNNCADEGKREAHICNGKCSDGKGTLPTRYVHVPLRNRLNSGNSGNPVLNWDLTGKGNPHLSWDWESLIPTATLHALWGPSACSDVTPLCPSRAFDPTRCQHVMQAVESLVVMMWVAVRVEDNRSYLCVARLLNCEMQASQWWFGRESASRCRRDGAGG